MDSQFDGSSSSMEGFKFDGETIFPNFDHNLNVGNGFKFNDLSLAVDVPFLQPDPNPGAPASAWPEIMEGDSSSPSDDSEFSETVLKYISQVLMEEDMEEKPCMFHDALALQAAEKSLYEVLCEKYPPSPNQPPLFGDPNQDSLDDCHSCSLSDCSSNSSSSSNTSTSIDSQWNGDLAEHKSSWLQTPLPTNFVFQSTSNSALQSSFNSSNNFTSSGNVLVGSSASELSVPNLFSNCESVFQFQRGVEEANKFLPKGNLLIFDLENYATPAELKDKPRKVVVKTEKDEEEHSPNQLTRKKSHEREDEDLEDGRSNKHSAVYVDEIELSEMFDKVLICGKEEPPVCTLDHSSKGGSSKMLQQNGQTNGSGGGKSRGKKSSSKKEVVDLRTLLILCAQAVSGDDRRTANELLKQIRQHSSPFGDGIQRLAHYFANSLEARLAGTGTQIYTALSSKRTSAADMLKAYQVYLSGCPFKKFSIAFTINNILALAEKAATLHIIDFGVSYGFQWPGLIYRLSMRPGGPPKLRITGIDLPQAGFRPGQGVQETGRRLARYCERYNVPFEYHTIAQKWETIQIDDLKIHHDEFLAVSCLFRFKNLLDETVVVDSPRDAVLNLIRKISPDIFIQAIVNGSYNAPFFVTRFREALFHFSALFDMCDTNIPREDEMRLMFEKEFYGREIMNVVACEGTERVERPETYKQWQARITRAGFKQLQLDPELMKKFRCKVKGCYHNDFMVDQDGHWMLQGWKGRVLYASSAWVPA